MSVIDTLVFCGEHVDGTRLDRSTILEVGTRAGIERHVLVAPRPLDARLDEANRRIAAVVTADPVHFEGLARIDANQGEAAVVEAERCLRDAAFAGLFLHPGDEAFAIEDRRLDAVIKVATDHGAPVVVATGIPWWSEALQVAALARRHPATPFVLTNGGQVNISGLGMQDAWSALESSPRLVIQTSGEYRQDFIEDVATRLGPERVIFASGAPRFEPEFEIPAGPVGRPARGCRDDDAGRRLGTDPGRPHPLIANVACPTFPPAEVVQT